MSADVATLDQQDRALARLLELGLAAAEKVQGRLMACEDDAMLGELTLSLTRASRNVRQTVALQLRAARERRQEAVAIDAEDRRAREDEVTRRKTQIRTRIERLVWEEYEASEDHGEEAEGEAEYLIDVLDDRVNEAALYDDFTQGPVEAHIERLCAELGVGEDADEDPCEEPGEAAAAPAAPRPLFPMLADEPEEDRKDDGHWRSSA